MKYFLAAVSVLLTVSLQAQTITNSTTQSTSGQATVSSSTITTGPGVTTSTVTNVAGQQSPTEIGILRTTTSVTVTPTATTTTTTIPVTSTTTNTYSNNTTNSTVSYSNSVTAATVTGTSTQTNVTNTTYASPATALPQMTQAGIFQLVGSLPSPQDRHDLSGYAFTNTAAGQAAQAGSELWIWVRPQGSSGSISGANSYSISGSGVDGGIEYGVNRANIVGFQIGSVNNSFSGMNNNSAGWTSTYGSIYSLSKVSGWTFRPLLGYSSNNYNNTRTIPTLGNSNAITTAGQTLYTDIRLYAPSVETTALYWSADVDYTPFFGVGYYNYRSPSLTESGTAATAVSWSSQSGKMGQTYIGMNIANKGTSKFFYSGELTGYFLSNSQVTYTGTLGNNNVSLSSQDIGNFMGVVNAKVGYRFSNTSEAYLSAIRQQASGFNNNIGMLGIRIGF